MNKKIRINRILVAIMLLYCTFALNAQVYYRVVAQDGSGTTKSLKIAIDKVPSNSTTPVLIYIKNGIYNEKIVVSKPNVHLIGESVDGVIITYGDYSGDGTHSTGDSYTFWADGNDFYAENITFRNSAGNVGQAVAIRTDGERQVFKNCKFIGFQDTYYAHSNMQYNLNCTIEGATDFIFGDATAIFDSCTINCLNGGQYITAPSDTKLTSLKKDGSTLYHGLMISNSLITANSDVSSSSYFLGRPWQPNASSVFINCTLGNHIKPAGWSEWSGNDNHLSGYYGEYRNKDINNTLIDTTNRVEWSHQIDSADVSDYYSMSYFFKKDTIVWDPLPKTIALQAPASLSGDGFSLTWSEVTDAIGYVVLRNDSTIGFSTTATFTDTTANNSVINKYVVKSIATYGNLSLQSNEYTVAATVSVKEVADTKNNISIDIENRVVYGTEPLNISVYSSAGILLLNEKQTMQASLSTLKNGIYILKAENKSGQVITKKIIL